MRRIHRRGFLVATGGLAIALAGCSSGQSDEKLEEGATQVENSVRQSDNIDLDIRPNGGWSQLTYVSFALSAGEASDDIRTIVMAYLSAIDDGYELGEGRVDVYNGDGNEVGEWRIDRKWIGRYNDGTLTAEGVYNEAIDSISTN